MIFPIHPVVRAFGECRARDAARLIGAVQAVILNLKQMKRLFQFVAVVVVALLAAQPALAALPCNMGAPACGPCAHCCGKTMSHMGMACQMAHKIAGAGCDQNCCHDALPRAVAQLTAGVKPKAGGTVYLASEPQIVAGTDASLVAEPPGKPAAAAPARYILFQVFRI
jgi:hypothetical protein